VGAGGWGTRRVISIICVASQSGDAQGGTAVGTGRSRDEAVQSILRVTCCGSHRGAPPTRILVHGKLWASQSRRRLSATLFALQPLLVRGLLWEQSGQQQPCNYYMGC
jgi:hypothetical protein